MLHLQTYRHKIAISLVITGFIILSLLTISNFFILNTFTVMADDTTSTPSPSPAPSNTPTPTTSTPSPSPAPSNTPTPTPTGSTTTPSNTPTSTPSPTSTGFTATPTPTNTPSPKPKHTQIYTPPPANKRKAPDITTETPTPSDTTIIIDDLSQYTPEKPTTTKETQKYEEVDQTISSTFLVIIPLTITSFTGLGVILKAFIH